MQRIHLGCVAVVVAASMGWAPVSARGAELRAGADVSCRPAAERLHYDCVIKLVNARTGAPLTGLTLRVGADMPSMPLAHNVRPVSARPGSEPGTYHVLIALEMHGVWALRLDISGALRDRIIKVMRFEDGAVSASDPKGPPRHGH